MIRPLTLDECAAMGRMAAEAFFDDPCWRHIFPEDADRRRLMPLLLEVSYRLDMELGARATAFEEDGALLGACVVFPKGGHGPGPLQWLRRAHRLLPMLAAPLCAFRALELLAAVERVRPAHAHYLKLLVVSPAAQGKGAGSALIAQALGATPPGEVLYLETFKPANVAYYQKRGFRVRMQVESQARPPFWTLGATSKK